MNRTAALDLTLIINEIFFSIQGETNRVGLPTVFIRLTGCPLRCVYCDTAYAFHHGKKMTLAKIVDAVAPYQTRQITVTGGEPLAQKHCKALLEVLCDRGYAVSLETSGALDINGIDSRVAKVVDLKTPASGEADKNRYDNLQHLAAHDQIKFVIADRNDYLWAKEMLAKHTLNARCEVLFSSVYQKLPDADLAAWILADRLPVRLQIQLHKHLWGDLPGR